MIDIVTFKLQLYIYALNWRSNSYSPHICAQLALKLYQLFLSRYFSLKLVIFNANPPQHIPALTDTAVAATLAVAGFNCTPLDDDHHHHDPDVSTCQKRVESCVHRLNNASSHHENSSSSSNYHHHHPDVSTCQKHVKSCVHRLNNASSHHENNSSSRSSPTTITTTILTCQRVKNASKDVFTASTTPPATTGTAAAVARVCNLFLLFFLLTLLLHVDCAVTNTSTLALNDHERGSRRRRVSSLW
jgi:hypothetical protein